MPLFPEESWYFCQVRKYAVDGRFGETKRKMELEKIDNLLAEVISKKDFPSRSVTASLLECIVLATYEELILHQTAYITAKCNNIILILYCLSILQIYDIG